jgi:hypothetical protein
VNVIYCPRNFSVSTAEKCKLSNDALPDDADSCHNEFKESLLRLHHERTSGIVDVSVISRKCIRFEVSRLIEYI